jgi:hypothetical protein
MCEAITSRPAFKGVVVTAFLMTLTLAASNPIEAGDSNTYCVYLDQSQDLQCTCNAGNEKKGQNGINGENVQNGRNVLDDGSTSLNYQKGHYQINNDHNGPNGKNDQNGINSENVQNGQNGRNVLDGSTSLNYQNGHYQINDGPNGQNGQNGLNKNEATTFPNNDLLISIHPDKVNSLQTEVASLKLDRCDSVNLKLDLRSLPQPFYRLKLENIRHVIINGIIVRPNDTVDFWFNNIAVNLTFKGEIECPQCPKGHQSEKVQILHEGKLVTSPHVAVTSSVPQLRLNVLKSGDLKFDNFVKKSNVDLSLKIRDVKSVTFLDSYFSDLMTSSVEIFNVDDVTVMHSEFHQCSDHFLVANTYVKNITIQDCLMEENAILTLSNDTTRVEKKCTISPILINTDEQFLGPECVNTVIGRWISTQQGSNPGVESTGAITLALVSSAILMTVVLMLYTLHRQGKLDPYL